jgi:hypothetical protein
MDNNIMIQRQLSRNPLPLDMGKFNVKMAICKMRLENIFMRKEKYIPFCAKSG